MLSSCLPLPLSSLGPGCRDRSGTLLLPDIIPKGIFFLTSDNSVLGALQEEHQNLPRNFSNNLTGELEDLRKKV